MPLQSKIQNLFKKKLIVFQAFWLYNNTNKEVSYQVDTSHLKGTAFNYIKGLEYVEPQSSVPLLFTFFPNTKEIYKVILLIILCDYLIYQYLLNKHMLVDSDVSEPCSDVDYTILYGLG